MVEGACRCSLRRPLPWRSPARGALAGRASAAPLSRGRSRLRSTWPACPSPAALVPPAARGGDRRVDQAAGAVPLECFDGIAVRDAFEAWRVRSTSTRSCAICARQSMWPRGRSPAAAPAPTASTSSRAAWARWAPPPESGSHGEAPSTSCCSGAPPAASRDARRSSACARPASRSRPSCATSARGRHCPRRCCRSSPVARCAACCMRPACSRTRPSATSPPSRSRACSGPRCTARGTCTG